MFKRFVCVLLTLCICAIGMPPLAAFSASAESLRFEAHGISLPTASDPDAPAAVLTDYDAWYAFACGFRGVDPACFSVRGSFDTRALLAIPFAEDGYVAEVKADAATVYVTCHTLGTRTAAQQYVLLETDPSSVKGKALVIQTVQTSSTAFRTDTAVACFGEAERDKTVFGSLDELTVFSQNVYGKTPDAVQELAAFDGSFFAEYLLLYTALPTPSSGYSLSIAPYALCTDDTVLVRRIKTVPAYDDYTFSVIGCYAYLLPVPRSLYHGQTVAVSDEISTEDDGYPSGVSVPFEQLHQSCSVRSDPAESRSTLIRTYEEWCAAVAADPLYGSQYRDVVDAAYFEDHAVVLLQVAGHFSSNIRSVYEVLCDGDRLTVVTEWNVPTEFYSSNVHERFAVGIRKDAVCTVQSVEQYDVRFSSVQTEDYSYDILPNGTARLTALEQTDGLVVIPSSVDGYDVSVIGEQLFLRNITAHTVILPPTVTTVEQGAFYSSCVERVVLPEGLRRIERSAFFNCDHLQRLYIPSGVEILEERSVGFGYYVDPNAPDLIPGSVGVEKNFVMITADNTTAEHYAADNGVTSVQPDDLPLGDTDLDGNVTTADGRLLLQYMLSGGIRSWRVSDMNRSGHADTGDVRLLLQAALL